MELVTRMFQNLRFRCGGDPRLSPSSRKKIVVLGTGWGSMNFLKGIDVTKYDVTIVSPRNYFNFTPLLASACGGTISPRSCVEPVRNKLFRGGRKVMDFYEAWATQLDRYNNLITCKSKNGEEFKLQYDYVVLSVGSENNTFDIPGVSENADFLKEVEHARTIRKKILDNLEQASLPVVSEEKKKRLLHFVVVGGGPTGVESAAEIADFVREDASKHYPLLIPYIKITLVEMLPKVLPTYSDRVSEYSLHNLQEMGIDTKMQCRVTEMTNESITLMGIRNQKEVLSCAFVLWASGVGQVPFSKTLLNSIPEQKGNEVLRVNERLQVIGAEPSIYALGDCSYVTPELLEKHTDSLYSDASKSPTGPGTTWLKSQTSLATRFPQFHSEFLKASAPQDHLKKDEFTELLRQIDRSFTVPPPTAQSATQEGLYLSSVFNRHFTSSSKEAAPAFLYCWKGFMAYIGKSRAAMDSPFGTLVGGLPVNLTWRFFYWSSQMSLHNKFSCLFDWSKVFFRGRDVGRDFSFGDLPRCPK